jgi:hypothetical protein
MRALEFTWDPARRYRCFVNQLAGIELQLTSDDSGPRDIRTPLGSEGEGIEEPFTTVVTANGDPVVRVDGERLLVLFLDEERVVWRRLGESSVYLGLDDRCLVALAVRDAEADEDGSSEAAWLDELEGTAGAATQQPGVPLAR